MNSQPLNVPAGWRRIKLKYLVALKSGDAIPGEEIKELGEYPVYGGNGFRGYTSSFTHEGERILIGRQGALCGNINYAKGRFWATEHAIVATPVPEFDTAWLGETLRAMNLNQYSQSAAQPGIAVEVIENLDIAVPPANEQRQIASLLRRITLPIDALVEEKQRLLHLLAEKRRAVIADLVTKGLNKDAPCRDSGIPWLGEVPEHWQTSRIAWLFRERDERCQPELPLLEVSIHAGVRIREFAEGRIEQMAEDFNSYKVARQGDIAFNKMRMWQGAVGNAPCNGLVSPDYVVAEPTVPLFSEFFGQLFKTPAFSAEAGSRSHGIVWDRLRLYWEEFRDIFVPVPPLDEQRAIVERVQIEASKLNALAEATERTIALLQERRSALISAAVTGQLDLETDHAN
jgi:type I restriction enzyme, S subunit